MSRYRSKKPSADVAALEQSVVIGIGAGVFLDLVTKAFGTGLPLFSFTGMTAGFITGFVRRKKIRDKINKGTK